MGTASESWSCFLPLLPGFLESCPNPIGLRSRKARLKMQGPGQGFELGPGGLNAGLAGPPSLKPIPETKSTLFIWVQDCLEDVCCLSQALGSTDLVLDLQKQPVQRLGVRVTINYPNNNLIT